MTCVKNTRSFFFFESQLIFQTLITFKKNCVPIKNESYPSLEQHEVEYSFLGELFLYSFVNNDSLLE